MRARSLDHTAHSCCGNSPAYYLDKNSSLSRAPLSQMPGRTKFLPGSRSVPRKLVTRFGDTVFSQALRPAVLLLLPLVSRCGSINV